MPGVLAMLMLNAAAAGWDPACRLALAETAELDLRPPPSIFHAPELLAEVSILRSYQVNWPHQKCASVGARLALLRSAADEFDSWCGAARRARRPRGRRGRSTAPRSPTKTSSATSVRPLACGSRDSRVGPATFSLLGERLPTTRSRGARRGARRGRQTARRRRQTASPQPAQCARSSQPAL